jgi:transcriptional regulator with XRE-family HTH domain
MNPIQKIKDQAKPLGITMTAVCAQAGIHQSQASRWLKGRARPLYESVVALELALAELIAAKHPAGPGPEHAEEVQTGTT